MRQGKDVVGCERLARQQAVSEQTLLRSVLQAAVAVAAAAQWGVPASEITVSQGVVLHAGKSFQARFGELAGRASKLDVPKNVALKKPADYKLVGKPIKRDDVRTKVFADFTFMQDVKVDGMVHARVIHPDAYGAQLETVDDTHAKKVPGFLRTVHVGNLLAVIANDEWAAIRSARALKATWSDWKGLPAQAKLYDAVRALPLHDQGKVLERGRP